MNDPESAGPYLEEPRFNDPVLAPGDEYRPRGGGWHLDSYLWDEQTGLARLRYERHGEHPVHVFEAKDDEGRPLMVMVRHDPAEGRLTYYPFEASTRPGRRPDWWRGARPDDVHVVHQMRPRDPSHEGWEIREPADHDALLASYFENLRQEMALAKKGAYAGPRPAIRRAAA